VVRAAPEGRAFVHREQRLEHVRVGVGGVEAEIEEAEDDEADPREQERARSRFGHASDGDHFGIPVKFKRYGAGWCIWLAENPR
jgi:L,D-peptidoglycan transpeptidase YkuD (ErfK/YbiS/YcfS/YnhG family)